LTFIKRTLKYEEILLFKQSHDNQLIQVKQESCGNEPIELEILDKTDGDSIDVVDNLISLALSTNVIDGIHQSSPHENRDHWWEVEGRPTFGSTKTGTPAVNQSKDISEMDTVKTTSAGIFYLCYT
jgi:hypothetical protein